MLRWAPCQRAQDGFRNLLKEAAQTKAGKNLKKLFIERNIKKVVITYSPHVWAASIFGA